VAVAISVRIAQKGLFRDTNRAKMSGYVSGFNGGAPSRTGILKAYETCKLPLLYTLCPSRDLHSVLHALNVVTW
jgi:hypothetical protein